MQMFCFYGYKYMAEWEEEPNYTQNNEHLKMHYNTVAIKQIPEYNFNKVQLSNSFLTNNSLIVI